MRYHRSEYESKLRYFEEVFIQTMFLSHEEVAKIAELMYSDSTRQKVESKENIGKMVIIDIESGDYEVDKNGLHAANRLSEKHPDARLYGIRMGYNVAASLGAVMERVCE
jgi:hypothetical protein